MPREGASHFCCVHLWQGLMKRPMSPRDSERRDYEGGEAEASSLASSSSPGARQDGFEYDVFLSFRGPDTRNGFTSHLYQALKDKGVFTFIDNEDLEKGQKVEELFGCIQRSKIFVPIFSKGYADSKWCLQEITKIAKCGRLIIPVFFDVEPRDVCHQTGPFARAFARYHKNKKIDKKEVSQWSDALREAGELSGYTLANTNGNQSMIVENIVRKIVREVNKTPLSIAEHAVGLNSRIADLMKMMEIEAHTEAKMVGIHGLGGVGKTTVAKAIYNKVSSHFDACCFLFNVRSEAANQSDRLISLQKQLLREVFKDKNMDIRNINEGIYIIKQRIRSKKVLLVLDDVDHESQLEALVDGVDWFCSGSRIIITTRDKGILTAAGVHKYNMYKLEGLDSFQSLQLFSWNAFRKEEPDLKFAELSKEVASVAAGLPLALKIFGSLFRDLKTVELWVSKLEELKKSQDNGLHEMLKISYDALDENAQKVFLDIACFFIGQGRENATYMWEGCGFFPYLKINDLICKCLVNVNDDTGEFEMHDHIRDMGRKIVQDRKYISRLWKDDEILDILQTKKGRKTIEAIQLYSGTYEKPMYVEAQSFVAMSKLRMLQLGEYVLLKGKFEHFPKELKWLQWCIKGHLDSLPDGLHLENIVVLDLSNSRITQLWNPQGLESTKVLEEMKVLKLAWCWNLTRCPDFKRMPHLKKLDLEQCQRMTKLDPSIGHLKNLKDLILRNCKSLKELPQEVSRLTSLINLDLTSCYQISALPESMRHLKQLKRLSLQRCSSLTEIPECICYFLNLEELDASHCQRIAFLPNWIEKLKSLIELDLSWTAIKELPHSIVSLENLQVLSVSHCYRLKFLPWFPPSLTPPEAKGCGNFVDVPGIKHMKSLRGLHLRGCRSLYDSFLRRFLEANFQNLGDFSISGQRLSSYPQSLSFLLPKQFETGILYLHVDINNLSSRPGRVVLIEITTGDAKFHFSALTKFQYRKTSEEGDIRTLPTATFGRDSELMKMAKQGEFNGNGDAGLGTMMTMRVSINGCIVLHGDLLTYKEGNVGWLNAEPIEVDDNLVVEFDW